MLEKIRETLFLARDRMWNQEPLYNAHAKAEIFFVAPS